MGTPFLGELKIISWNYAPKGWAFANGQQLPINQNQALFSLLGTTYGGNGQTTFALPDMRGLVPIHFGGGFILGEKGGQEAHTVTASEMPQHIHFLVGRGDNATTDSPDSTVVLATSSIDLYRQPTNLVAMDPGIVGNVGGSQPHNNMQPYTTLNIIIALQGVFPSRN
ncbi:MAG TPA: tail fiber protein [Allosphingosinicella sp.]|nr:tail fiber protein [Allosphingosinicella sp.]